MDAVRVSLAEKAAELLRRDPDLSGHRGRGRPGRPGLARGARSAPRADRARARRGAAVPRALGGAPAVDPRRHRPQRAPAAVLRPPGLGRRSGARRRVSVVFTDLEGFTRFTARRRRRGRPLPARRPPPDDRAHRAQPRRQGRQAARRRADAVLPRAPRPPCYCALDLVEVPADLRLRAGVHVGEAVVTADDLIGHDVNIAARVAAVGQGRAGAGHGRACATRSASCAASTFGRARRRTFKGVGEADQRLPRRPLVAEHRWPTPDRAPRSWPSRPTRARRRARTSTRASSTGVRADVERGRAVRRRCWRRTRTTRSAPRSRCASSARCTASCSTVGRRSWPRSTRPSAATPTRATSARVFVGDGARARRRGGAADRRRRADERGRPLGAARRRLRRGGGTARACRCGCSRSAPARGSTCAGTTTPTTRAPPSPATRTARCGSPACGTGTPPALPPALRRSVERRGCDRNPLDPTTDEGCRTLARLRVARPARPVRAAARRRRGGPPRARRRRAGRRRSSGSSTAGRSRPRGGDGGGRTRSCCSTCPPSAAAARRRRSPPRASGPSPRRAAGLAAHGARPATHAELRLTTWPGGDERLLATAGFHGRPIRWLAASGACHGRAR